MSSRRLRCSIVRGRDLGLGDEELREFEGQLVQNLVAGRVMRGTGGARKIRFAPSTVARGKSGALRIIYSFFPLYAHVLLILAYGKGEKAELTARERSACVELLKRYEAGLRKRATK